MIANLLKAWRVNSEFKISYLQCKKRNGITKKGFALFYKMITKVILFHTILEFCCKVRTSLF